MNHKLNTLTVKPQSKMIDLLEYDYPSMSLRVTLSKGGSVFKKKTTIEDISYREFLTLLEADSIGKAVLEKIKKRTYQYA